MSLFVAFHSNDYEMIKRFQEIARRLGAEVEATAAEWQHHSQRHVYRLMLKTHHRKQVYNIVASRVKSGIVQSIRKVRYWYREQSYSVSLEK
jgi:tRNA A37 N6-isopentenylltransferase MiaA